MTCLDATFTLTPTAPTFVDAQQNYGTLTCFGTDVLSFGPYDLSSDYAENQFLFWTVFAADPKADYSDWNNRIKTRFLEVELNLTAVPDAANRQLVLICAANAPLGGDAEVLIYSDAGLIKQQTIAVGDNQFVLEIESLAQPINLYFIHAGGSWLFNGISGYVA